MAKYAKSIKKDVKLQQKTSGCAIKTVKEQG
jgi:hypothetical protein